MVLIVFEADLWLIGGELYVAPDRPNPELYWFLLNILKRW
jgi:hypothetical protein